MGWDGYVGLALRWAAYEKKNGWYLVEQFLLELVVPLRLLLLFLLLPSVFLLMIVSSDEGSGTGKKASMRTLFFFPRSSQLSPR